MTCHFTYEEKIDKTQLRQGDLLLKTDKIRDLLEEIHPHYLKDGYKFFLVLTQSCDLLRRGDKGCSAKYITLAAVRPLDNVLQREAARYQKSPVHRKGCICPETKRDSLSQFLVRLLNNNHPEYFFLYEDASIGLSETCCAFIRLSIAIRAMEHYDKCLEAKFLELKESFRAKLGWLAGNLYSRIGTEDWTPENRTKAAFKTMIEDILDRNLFFFDQRVIKTLQEKFKDVDQESLDQESILKTAKAVKIPAKKEKLNLLAERVSQILKGLDALPEGFDTDRLLARMKADPVISTHVK
jgi:hypothetical protein